jgi:hypothetical protein
MSPMRLEPEQGYRRSMQGAVVTRPFRESNIGSNLASLAGAVWLARQLDRELIVDWRGLSQLGDPSLNYFAEFFETPSEILGVPARYAPVSDADYDAITPTEPGYAHLMGTGQSAVPEENIVLTAYHGLDRLHPGPDAERYGLLRAFYRAVRPAREIAERVESWWAQNLDGSFVVGVNVRTGNGRYFGKGMRYEGRVDVSLFDDRDRFLRKIDRACRGRTRHLPQSLRRSAKVFYATDSQQMSELLAKLPNAVTRRNVFPPAGSGDTYRFDGAEYSDRDSIVDTLADMFLLARCDALVFNSSMFNQFARVLNADFGGNVAHIETLYLGWHVRHMRSRLARLPRRVRSAAAARRPSPTQ